tara:strand:+ start:346 stop:1164 length:819 start_codon:yes stop_codon:yes gene_type:complete
METAPKKRGRKPGSKNKVKTNKEDVKTEKKKRGRKPKTNITINENPIFESDEKIYNNLIVKINTKDYNISYNNLNKEVNKLLNENDNSLDNELDNSLDNELENELENELDNNKLDKINKNSNNLICWNCCNKFNNIIIGLPIKYVDNIFYTYGNFCSLECSTRFCFDNFKNNISEIYTIINLYNNIVNKKIENVKCAPHRLSLNIFGGSLTIEEYRKSFKNQDYYNITIPPIVQLNTQISQPEHNKYYNKEHLKLFRKKELNNNNIINMMTK